jgi:Ser/Thr protein kinase RdoA (MazF antagonist)
MEPSQEQRAVQAGMSTAAELGLRVDDAVVLHSSNRIAVHLTPCDVLARVGPGASESSFAFELEVAATLAATGAPVAEPEPRVDPGVHRRDGFAITLWTHYEPIGSSALAADEYAQTLVELHAGLRKIDVRTPHFTDRVAEAQSHVADREETPELADDDRAFLADALRDLRAEVTGRGAGEQTLHGEPHPGNLLRTARGLLLIDFETCCRGPIEFDLAHGLLPDRDGRTLRADEVCAHHPTADLDLVERSYALMWAMITAWRWQRDDDLPNRSYWAVEGLNRLRAARDR